MSRAQLVRIITFLGGLYFVLEFLLPESTLSYLGVAAAHDKISYGFITVGAVSFGLGLINLFSHHGRKIVYMRDGAFFSCVLLGGLLITLIVGTLEWRASYTSEQWQAKPRNLAAFAARIASDSDYSGRGDQITLPFERRVVLLIDATRDMHMKAVDYFPDLLPSYEALHIKLGELEQDYQLINDSAWRNSFASILEEYGVHLGAASRESYERSTIKKAHLFVVEGLFNSLGAAMFSLLAVYIATSAFRAFRVRSFESFLMMMAAVLVILGQTFVGAFISPMFSEIRLWLLEVPNSAAFRAIKFGAAIAGLVIAIRMWLSIESGSFSVRPSSRSKAV